MSEHELLSLYSVTHDEEGGNRCQKKEGKRQTEGGTGAMLLE